MESADTADQQRQAPRRGAGTVPRVWLLGVPVDALSMAAAVERIGAWAATTRSAAAGSGAARQVVTLNPEMVMAARHDDNLRAAIIASDLVLADGMGIVWAARLRGVVLTERVAGVDLVTALAAHAATHGERLFLLGGAPGMAAAAARALERRFAGLVIAGTYAGSPAPAADAETLRRIRAARPDVLCVAYGSPAQERWIARLRGELGVAVAIGVGGALDFLSGRVPRAPDWMRHAGLEWLYRLWRQPWRWRRMLALPRFALAVCRQRVRWPASR